VTDKIRFKVTLFPNGHMMIATEQALTVQETMMMRDAFRQWRDEENGILVIGQAQVQVAEVEYTPLEITVSAPRDEDDDPSAPWNDGGASS
jgi:hypothetical protein